MNRLTRIMFVWGFLLASTLGYASNSTYAQNQSFTFEFTQTSILTIFQYIEKHSEFIFMYRKDLLDTSKKVSVKADHLTIDKVLDLILKDEGVSYEINNRQILLKKGKSKGIIPQQDTPKKQVQGFIKDEMGEPIIGATVRVKGSAIGTTTDINGLYKLTVTSANSVLVISYIGYITQEIKVGNRQDILVTLKEDTKTLDEVVVVGFATQKKENLTGAVASIDTKILKERPVQNVTQALQGVSPGLNITQDTGAMDASPSINIRGMTTIGEGSNGSPLILIDGVEGNINLLNPDDIANISVLKDASSAAIYGSRAAFGVILITTKEGQAQKPVVSYKNSFRWSSPMGLQHQADSYSWALFMNDADLTGNYFSEEYLDRILRYQLGELKEAKQVGTDGKYVGVWNKGSNANVNWGSELFKKRAFSQEHQASVQSGNEKVQLYSSLNYLDMNGMLKYGKDKYERLGAYIKVSANLWDIVDITYSSRYSKEKYKQPSAFQTDDYQNWGRQQWPMFPVYDNNGNLDAEGGRAYSHANTRDGKVKDSKMILQHVILSVQPIKDWFIKGEVSYVGNDTHTHVHWNKSYTYDIDNNPILYGDGSTSLYETAQYDNHMTYSLYSNFSHQWKKKHNLFVTAGMQAEDYNIKEFSAGRNGLIMDGIYSLNSTTGLDGNGQPVEADVSGWLGKWANAGFFGRVAYNYEERYLFEINARYDGSSRFRKENRWVWSPSVSLAWNIAREKFWSSFNDYVHLLKVRASYGQLANQSTNDWYPTYAVMSLETNKGNWLVNGKRPNTVSYPNLISTSLTWETIRTFDIGLDVRALSNRMTTSFDWYRRDTKDMIGPAPVLPSALGAASPRMNNTSLKTIGWELSIGWQDRIRDFNYSMNLMLSDNKTIITDYPATVRDVDKYFKGKNIGDIYGYTTIGIARTDKEMKNHLTSLPNGGQTAIGNNWAAGDIMYEDINGDGKIDNGDGTIDNPGDLTVIGNSSPHFKFGTNITMSWKGLDLSMFWQGVLKQDFSPGPDNTTFFGAVGGSIWWSQALKQHLDYFRNVSDHPLGMNLNSYYPRPLFQGGKKNQQHQTRYVQNAAYLRLKNISFGYTLPSEWTQKFRCSNFRIFVSGENLLTITRLTDIYDPETMWGGYYGTVYPLSKTISIGANLTF